MDIMIVLKIILTIILFIFIVLILRKSNASKKAKRIGFYSLDYTDDNNSFTDRFINKYLSFIKSMRPYISKSSYLSNRALKYEKYIKYKNRDEVLPIDYISNKIVISLAFIILTIFSQVFTNNRFSIFEIIINYFVGYYLLDFYLYFNYKRQAKLIENELLRAIIIMNNAFKSGKSTLQALRIASKELPEPICDEFKKMYLDMKYGLSVDTVFERFSQRVKLEEASYVSSSLTILNKTGGNIVEVFSSIERTLFDRKKLNEELKNISSGPKLIVRVLFLVPIVFTLIIYLLNPSYFTPLFSSPLGIIIIGIIIVMFTIYILLLKKILKIEV